MIALPVVSMASGPCSNCGSPASACWTKQQGGQGKCCGSCNHPSREVN